MKELCFTDHVDYGVGYDAGEIALLEDTSNRENVNYRKYGKEIKGLNQLYGDNIRIKTGLELGIQKQTIPTFEKLFHQYSFGFIILSGHQIEDKEF